MAMKVEIISSEIIKPSSPTPNHLKNYKICFFDEFAPPTYVPLLLLYSADEFGAHYIGADGQVIADKLKGSLSKTLARFYPLCGKLRGEFYVECTDDGALYVETRVGAPVSEILDNRSDREVICKLLPFDPYVTKTDEEAFLTCVQVNVFSCGGVGIGVCLSHKIADVSTMSTFLNAWATTASRGDQTQAPWLDAATIFPPKGKIVKPAGGALKSDKNVTKTFEFTGKNLSTLKAKIGNTSRGLAVTALIWKAAMEAAKINSGKTTLQPSIAIQPVNFRGRMDPPLPENSMGNMVTSAVAKYVDAKSNVELDELVGLLRKKIQDIKHDHVTLESEKLCRKFEEQYKEVWELVSEVALSQLYLFSSWSCFPLYNFDFGWGRPKKVCTLNFVVGNCVILLSTKCGDGIEALVSLSEEDMKEFESNQELLQFVST